MRPKVWRKQSVVWVTGGKRVKAGTPHAKRKTIHSNHHYGTLRLANGKTKQQPLTLAKASSLTLLRRLQTNEDDKRANGTTDYAEHRGRPVSELLTEYETYLRNKRNTPHHVSQTIHHICRLLTATKAKAIGDIDAGRITTTLAAWRQREDKPLGVRTTNYYARAVKGFSRWLWTDRKTPDDMLMSLRLLNANGERKRQRRALTPDELTRLVTATEKSGTTRYGLSPKDRAMLYRVAALTGLRARELASLTPASIDLEAKTISVQAGYSKRRRHDTLPLHPSLIGLLASWLTTKTQAETLWRGTFVTQHEVNAAAMLRGDLGDADVPYIDPQGRYADFHALRHTFITSLARSGVHPAKAKELARHSTITLTMDVYTALDVGELRDAIATLPTF